MATIPARTAREIEAKIMQLLSRFPLTESSVKQMLFSTSPVEIMHALDRLTQSKRVLFTEGTYRFNPTWQPTYEISEIEAALVDHLAKTFGAQIEPATTGRPDQERVFVATVAGHRFDVLITDRGFSQANGEGPQKQ